MIAPLNILVAYPYFKKPVVEQLKRFKKNSYRLIVDSGAFTAWNIGKTIRLDDYCRFLDSIEHLRPFNAVQLDVFGDPEKTWENFLIMKKRGFDVMPVFTRGDSLERLEEMYSYTDYIMFGGITIGGKNINYVKWFMENNKQRAVHWLGFCNVDFIKHFKPFSVDSSSWASGSRYGNVHFYKGFGATVSANRRKLLDKPSPQLFECAKRSGVTVQEMGLLRHSESWIETTKVPDMTKPEKGVAKMIGTISYVHRAVDLEKNLGTRFYLAAAAPHQIDMIFAARNFLVERGIIDGLDSSKQRPKSQIVRVRRDGLSHEVRSRSS